MTTKKPTKDQTETKLTGTAVPVIFPKRDQSAIVKRGWVTRRENAAAKARLVAALDQFAAQTAEREATIELQKAIWDQQRAARSMAGNNSVRGCQVQPRKVRHGRGSSRRIRRSRR